MAVFSEALRCLRIVEKSGAQLETPLRTEAMRWLPGRGFIHETRNYQSAWGGRLHDVVQLEITDSGRRALRDLSEFQ